MKEAIYKGLALIVLYIILAIVDLNYWDGWIFTDSKNAFDIIYYVALGYGIALFYNRKKIK